MINKYGPLTYFIKPDHFQAVRLCRFIIPSIICHDIFFSFFPRGRIRLLLEYFQDFVYKKLFYAVLTLFISVSVLFIRANDS